jgi:hypothetical protein
MLPPEEDEIHVHPSGAKESKLHERYDLLPPEAMRRLGKVLAYGANKYGDDNWHGIPLKAHLNHLIRHAIEYLAGDKSEDHLGHVLCRAAMAIWAQENLEHEHPEKS